MIAEYETYENKRNEIHKSYEMHLLGFEKWLKSKGLSEKTINTHVRNVEFYIFDFLFYYGAPDISQGCHRIGSFLGDWFIRKTTWSSCAHIKANAVGIKKFYAYLLEVNVVEHEDYDELCDIIKEDMPEWLEEMKRYDDMVFQDYY